MSDEPDTPDEYDLLRTWERQIDGGGSADLDAFVETQCRDADPNQVAAFRQLAAALLSVRPDLRRFGLGPGTGPTPDDFAPGREPIPGYRLARRIGRGGYGEVWRAAAPDGRDVAIKSVPKTEAEGELRAVHLLCDTAGHPHLIRYHEAWETDYHLLVVMELADGTTADRLREARAAGLDGIPRDELLGYMAAAAEGLDFLHSGRLGGSAVLHRDVKPGNLLLAGGTLKVGDFGLVRPTARSVTRHTGYHTLEFAAPEFIDNRATPASDQYSLAVAYCELRGGRRPFDGTDAAIIAGHLNREPDLSMLPAGERPVVRRALAKTPRHRWPSCAAFVAALRDGVNPTAVRRELVADMRNFTLRRLYLAVRGPAHVRADARTHIESPEGLWASVMSTAVLGTVVLGSYAVALAQATPMPTWFVWLVPCATLPVVARCARWHRAHRVRAGLLGEVASELGPIDHFPSPPPSLDELRALYLPPDHDVTDLTSGATGRPPDQPRGATP